MRITVMWRIAVLASVLPSLAAADPITITFTRFVSGSAEIAIAGADEFAEFSDGGAGVLDGRATLSVGLGSARAAGTLSSTISNDSRRVTAAGSASGTAHSVGSVDGTSAAARALANVSWSFRLDEPHLFTLAGTFAASPLEASTDPGRFSSALLDTTLHSASADGAVFELLFSQSTRVSDAVTHTGRLGQGFYHFLWQSRADTSHISTFGESGPGAASAEFGFVFDLVPDPAPVPEPGSVLLLGAGLIAAVTASRKRKQGISDPRAVKISAPRAGRA